MQITFILVFLKQILFKAIMNIILYTPSILVALLLFYYIYNKHLKILICWVLHHALEPIRSRA